MNVPHRVNISRPSVAYLFRKEKEKLMVTELKQTIHQCAWCRSLIVNGERIEDIPGFVADNHGICKVCACAMELQCMDSYSNE